MATRYIVLVLALVGCSSTIAPDIEPEPECTTFVVTEYGDTVAFVGLDVPPENLAAVVDWWTDCDHL